ncbi:hypothetical protein SADUNF_Sadunf10G0151000 [Salix dunnii]|uniref:Uncharacterized protein n=1 Tax=Salix dunnii TaxID=1413687 RepID=A0A835JUE7_9ROSI|nr:hypothetical protein SADUNF_Sadunf10G0151000 [Salix dunnii]
MKSFVVTLKAKLGETAISGALIWDDGEHQLFVFKKNEGLSKQVLTASPKHFADQPSPVPAPLRGFLPLILSWKKKWSLLTFSREDAYGTL